jgi:hypothetical protein
VTWVRLAEIAVVTAQARAGVYASTEGYADPEAAEARRSVTVAGEHLMLAAGSPAWGVRVDDGPTVLGQVAASGMTSAAAGLAAFLCADLLGLASAGIAVAVLVSFVAAEWFGKRLLIWIGRAARRRRTAVWWPAENGGRVSTPPGVLDGQALIGRAREAIGELAVDRLAALPDLTRTGPAVMDACQHDVVLRHLRAADTLLCLGSYALQRLRKGRSR